MPKQVGTCEHCRKEFTSYAAQRFCSRACQKAACRNTTTCPNCGTEFWYHRSWPRIYCSRKCSAAHNALSNLGVVLLPPQHCEQCGKEITADKYARRRFCSQECFGAYLTTRTGNLHPTYKAESHVERTCEECGKTFTTHQWEIDKGWGRFCGRPCAARWQAREQGANPLPVMSGPDNPRWKGGYEPYYGPNWRSQRRNARRRDNYTCQRCGVTESELGRQLDVHHVHRFGDFGPDRYQEANQLDNLICLCYACHTWVEHNGLD